MLSVDSVNGDNEINIDFTNSYTINLIVIDGITQNAFYNQGYSRFFYVGVYDYDSATDTETRVGLCNGGDYIDSDIRQHHEIDCSVTGNRVKLSKATSICEDQLTFNGGCRNYRLAGLAVFSDVAGLTDPCEEDIQLQKPTVEALTDGSYETFTAITIPTAILDNVANSGSFISRHDDEFYVASIIEGQTISVKLDWPISATGVCQFTAVIRYRADSEASAKVGASISTVPEVFTVTQPTF